MTRYIRYFDKYSEKYIGKYKFPINLYLNDLIDHLGNRVSNDPMLYITAMRFTKRKRTFMKKNFI